MFSLASSTPSYFQNPSEFPCNQKQNVILLDHPTYIQTLNSPNMTSTKTQNALFVAELGKLTAGSREIPTPAEGEVLIKVTATQRQSLLPILPIRP